jgi:hypothetical protein
MWSRTARQQQSRTSWTGMGRCPRARKRLPDVQRIALCIPGATVDRVEGDGIGQGQSRTDNRELRGTAHFGEQ